MRGKWMTMTAALVATMLASGCAGTPPTERQADRLAVVESAAGDTVDSIWYQRLVSWEPLAEDRLLIWTRANEAWLLRVDRPCPELMWASDIGIRTQGSRITTGFDQIEVRGDRCRIREIRSVDAAAVRGRQALQDPRQPDGGT